MFFDISLSYNWKVWLYVITGVIFGITFAVSFSRIIYKRSIHLINDWAQLHNFTIMKIRQPLIVPYWKSSSSRWYSFFHVELKDDDGIIRVCWIRCRNFFAVETDSLEVIWDKKK